MKAEGMTIREIAELCGIGETTVRRWADTTSAEMADLRAKMAEAQETKKAARFTLEETLAIIRAGGKGLLADLLEQNARGGLPVPKPAPVLSGAYFRELRFMVKERILSPRQVQMVLGVAPAAPEGPATVLQLEAPASEEQGAAAFAEILRRIDDRGARRGLPEGAVERVVRAAAGATRKTLQAIERETAQGALF